MPCYSFVYSCSVNCGIIVWGTATQNQLHEINARLNNIVRTIIWNTKFSHVSNFVRSLLSLCIKFAIINCRFRFNNNLIILNKYTLIKQTKLLNLTIFYLELGNCRAKKKLEFRGAKLWNEIDKDIKFKAFNSLKSVLKKNYITILTWF